MTGEVVKKGEKILQPGQILLSKDNTKLSNILSRLQPVSHCGLHIGNGIVLERKGNGVHATNFYDFCYHSDRVIILESNEDPRYDMAPMIERGKQMIGTPLDFSDNLPEHNFCAGFINHIDEEQRLGIGRSKMFGFFGPDIVLPLDIYNATGLRVVWDSDNK